MSYEALDEKQILELLTATNVLVDKIFEFPVRTKEEISTAVGQINTVKNLCAALKEHPCMEKKSIAAIVINSLSKINYMIHNLEERIKGCNN